MPTTTPDDLAVETSKKKAVSGPDRAVAGWPEQSKIPFVEPAYYDEFPEKLRPKFLPGSLTSVNMSYDAMRQAQIMWEKPFELITVVNMSLKDWLVHIPGAQPGQMASVKVPPFGVLRGPLHKELNAGLEGSRFPLRGAIPAMGNCGGKHILKLEDGTELASCRFFNCPHHRMGGMAHSIQMAYHFISSIGEALPDPRNPDHQASYVPPLDYAEKEVWKYQNLDPRPEVTMWAAKRLMHLKEREARFKVMNSRGIPVGGR